MSAAPGARPPRKSVEQACERWHNSDGLVSSNERPPHSRVAEGVLFPHGLGSPNPPTGKATSLGRTGELGITHTGVSPPPAAKPCGPHPYEGAGAGLLVVSVIGRAHGSFLWQRASGRLEQRPFGCLDVHPRPGFLQVGDGRQCFGRPRVGCATSPEKTRTPPQR